MDAEPQITKRCPRCRQTLPASAFWRCACRKDGLQTACKSCTKSRYRDGPVTGYRPNPTGTKKCSGCKQIFPLVEFHRNRRSPDGFSCYCKICGRANVKKYSAKYYEKFHEKRQHTPFAKENGYLRRHYGITYPQYLALLESQGGVCAICGERPVTKRLKVDHSHQTGKLRGLLCQNCNMGLGDARDNIGALQGAIAYLSRWLPIEFDDEPVLTFPFE